MLATLSCRAIQSVSEVAAPSLQKKAPKMATIFTFHLLEKLLKIFIPLDNFNEDFDALGIHAMPFLIHIMISKFFLMLPCCPILHIIA